MSKKNERPDTPPSDPDKVGYGKPPKHSQFKKGQSGNPKGRPKEVKAHMPVSRIIRHSLSEEVQGQVNGRTRKMTKLEAIIEVQSAKALKGDTRAAKLVIDLGHKHIAPHQTLEELKGDRPLFTFTEEEAARFTKAKLIEGMVVPEKHDDPPKEDDDPPKEDDDDGKSVL
jgi:Family of unknown function (DUF5681)